MRVLLALFIALVAATAIAQPLPASKPAPPVIQPGTPPQSNADEVAALRAQVEIMKEYKEDLLTTVYSALGGVFGVVLLLGGWSWFGAHRIQQSEIRSIRSELQNDLNAWKLEIDKGLTELTNLQQKATEEAISKSIDLKITELSKKIVDTKRSVLSTKNQLLRQIAITDMRYWEAKNVPANVFSSCIALLNAAKRDNESWEINHALNKLTTIARTDRADIDADNISDLMPVLDALPAEYSINVGHLKDALRRPA